jgi:hypothetical protein
MIGAAVKGALLRPALRVALDGGVDHETIHGRQDKPAAVELKKSTCCTSFVKPPCVPVRYNLVHCHRNEESRQWKQREVFLQNLHLRLAEEMMYSISPTRYGVNSQFCS